MQTIYVDTLLFINIFINYILLYLVMKTLHIRTKAYRIIAASIVGAIVALGVFLPFYNTLLSVVLKAGGSILMVLTAFGKTDIRRLLLRATCTIISSITLSGFIMLIWLIFKPQGFVIFNDTLYLDISPVFLIILTIVVFTILSIYERIKSKVNIRTRIHKVTVISENSTYTFDSMVDTGCNLKEPFSGLPVIIAERELICEKDITKESMRIVPVNTITSEGALFAYKPKQIKIDGKTLENGCYIAISEGKLKNEVKSLMGAEISEGI